MLKKIVSLVDGLLNVIMGLLVTVLLLYSGYVLYDNFNTDRTAFSSWDLLLYKPAADAGSDEGFQDLLDINPDVAGWLTMYDTNIDYPVVQGEDNLEYINKDVHGYFSLSGSIYIATECAPDFSDAFTLIYGHHMDNGAMFGDIEEFADPGYFQNHMTGLIQTTGGNFDLRAFAFVRTTAYEPLIYSPKERTYDDLADYIRENAAVYDAMETTADGRLVALSTCADIETNGRQVLFCQLTERTAPVEVQEKTEKTVRRQAVGHGSIGETWALLNLVCALLTVYTLFPLGNLRVKYRQIGYSRRMSHQLAEAGRQPHVVRDLRQFRKLMRTGIVLEAMVAAGEALLFFQTENLRRNMVILDRWTPVMIVIFALALLIDFACFRYRGRRPKEE